MQFFLENIDHDIKYYTHRYNLWCLFGLVMRNHYCDLFEKHKTQLYKLIPVDDNLYIN